MEIAIGLLALAIAVIAIIIPYRQNMPAQRAAIAELKGPIYRLQINKTAADHIIWVLPWKNNDRFHVMDLELNLHNTSMSESLEGAFIIMELASLVYGVDVPRRLQSSSRIIKLERFDDPVAKTEKTRVTYRIGDIQPNVQVCIGDFIGLGGSSRIRSSINAPSADGVMVKAVFEMVVGFDIDITVVASNARPTQRTISILTFDPSDKLVSLLSNHKEAISKVKAEPGVLYEAEVAAIFFGDNIDCNPQEFPPQLREKYARVHLRGSRYTMGLWHSELGCLPFRRETRKRRHWSFRRHRAARP